MIYINQDIQIPEKEIIFEFIRSSGPGGQNVNKVATAAQLRFNVETSPSLPQDVKERLYKIARNRINNEGELIITAKRYRTQEKNRKDAIERLIKLITSAAEKPKIRKRRTRLSLAAKKKRMEEKRKISDKKQKRRFKPEYWMKLKICLLSILVVVVGNGQSPKAINPFEQNKLLRRTVNLGNYLEAPTLGAWGVEMKNEYYPLIKQAGFTAVRIPVRWSAFADTISPYKIAPDFFSIVDKAIFNALDNNLSVLLNMHHYQEIFERPQKHQQRFLNLWEQIADHYKDVPNQVIFELLNEPHNHLSAEVWEEMFLKTIAIVRKTNPHRTLMIGPDYWNNVNFLETLNLPKDDQNLIATFHYYLPFHFTHQGASWVENSGPWLGQTWTATENQKAAVDADLDKAVAWAAKNNRPLFLGEFGAYSKADMASRAIWTNYVARASEKRNISWGYWEFCAGFGVYDRNNSKWREPLLQALIPN